MVCLAKRRAFFSSVLALVSLMNARARAQTVPSSPTSVLAPLAGRMYQPAAGQSNIGFAGTDLGFTFKHNGQLRILFGDTWSDFIVDPSNLSVWPLPISLWTGSTPRDDAQGIICMTANGCPGGNVFNRGDSVNQYVQSHQHSGSELLWQNDAPPVWFRTGLDAKIASMHPYRGGASGTILAMGPGRTPVAGFSNSRPANADSGAFTMFHRGVAVQCATGTRTCPVGFTCDAFMGTIDGITSEDAVPCMSGANCRALPTSGICVDTTNGLFNAADPNARLQSVALREEIGNADLGVDEIYYTRSWFTNKFVNPAVRTVRDFSPSRANGAGNNYNPPADATVSNSAKVFLWGRPSFWGSATRRVGVFFAFVDMPLFRSDGNVAWTVNYFTGLNGSGVPQFTTDPGRAKLLNLNGRADGLATDEAEKWDVVNQISVAFVAPLNKWVMLYGGDLNHAALAAVSPGAVPDPEGAIHIRFASQPWGPWSKPVQLFKAGSPDGSVTGTQYGPLGILAHPTKCRLSSCAPPEPVTVQGPGFLYGANLIPEWTEDRGTSVDIFWNVSTWNPYQVVLMRSRINK
jgi:hypothetical protein